MRKLLPLNALRAFEAAARHRSFKAAASELCVSPTAVSHQIRLLEELCGHQLFRRRPRPVTLTRAGERLFPVLREGFDAFSSAIAAFGDEAAQHRLRVSTTKAFASRWLLPRLASWREQHAEIDLEVEATEAVVDLRAGEAAVSVRYARTPPADLDARAIVSDRFVPVCSPALLDGQGTPLDRIVRSRLLHFRWYRSDDAAPTWAAWRARAMAVDPSAGALDVDRGTRLSEESHAIEVAVAGQGIALVSDVLAADELAAGRLVALTDIALEGRTYFAVSLRQSPRAHLVRDFVAWMQRQARYL